MALDLEVEVLVLEAKVLGLDLGGSLADGGEIVGNEVGEVDVGGVTAAAAVAADVGTGTSTGCTGVAAAAAATVAAAAGVDAGIED